MSRILLASIIFISSFSCFGETTKTNDNFAYYGLEPDIITNYISTNAKLGYIKVSVELMVNDPKNLDVLDYNEPLIRSAILEILGSKTEAQIKSLDGKEAIRKDCYNAVNRVLEQEVGSSVVVSNLLFTKYLYE